MTSRAAPDSQVWRNSVTGHFRCLKEARTLDEALVKAIPLARSAGFLVPVCELHADDAAAIEQFSAWRRENADCFPTQFPVTDAGTRTWLRSRLLDVPDRLLFFVVDRFGNRLGHLGFANCWNDERSMEVDNVVRGVASAAPGIMSEAMQAMLDWAERLFAPTTVFLRVFSDNAHGVCFYERLGFVRDALLPLERRVNGEVVSFVPTQGRADRAFLRMLWRPRREIGDEMILTAGPSVSGREAWYALDAARHGWRQNWSGYLDRFAERFAEYIGAPYAIPTSSCTGALHIALLALGIEPGDEVIVPDLTWVATANAVRYAGATPVFADVERDSWCIDPASVRQLLNERTKAIIPVHLYGHAARMDEIVALARQRGLYVIEDAAPAVGAEFQGRKVGTFGDFAAFSFQGAKLLVTGEGGMLVTANEDLYRTAAVIADQGRRPGTFWIESSGLKYKMSNLQAAFGLAQLERVDELIAAKRRIFSWYEEELSGCHRLTLNRERSWARSIYWMTSCLVDASVDRDGVRAALRAKNIDTRPVFPAISQYPIWEATQPPRKNAADIGARGINLPSAVWLTRDEIRYVSRALSEAVRGGS